MVYEQKTIVGSRAPIRAGCLANGSSNTNSDNYGFAIKLHGVPSPSASTLKSTAVASPAQSPTSQFAASPHRGEIQAFFADQLAESQRFLADQCEAATKMATMRDEARKRAEAELVRLRSQVRSVKDMLQPHSGVKGEAERLRSVAAIFDSVEAPPSPLSQFAVQAPPIAGLSVLASSSPRSPWVGEQQMRRMEPPPLPPFNLPGILADPEERSLSAYSQGADFDYNDEANTVFSRVVSPVSAAANEKMLNEVLDDEESAPNEDTDGMKWRTAGFRVSAEKPQVNIRDDTEPRERTTTTMATEDQPTGECQASSELDLAQKASMATTETLITVAGRCSAAGRGGEPPCAQQRKTLRTQASFGNLALPDANDARQKARRAVLMKEDVYAFKDYHEHGRIAKIARSSWFEHFTFFVIAFNAGWIAYDTDTNGTKLFTECAVWFQIVEHVVCFYFTFEVTIRFLAYEKKVACLKDRWFIFDASLAILMVLETWVLLFFLPLFVSTSASGTGVSNTSVLRVFRLVRLTRLARIARLVNALPELMILIKGMAVATRSVFFTFALLVVIIYIFGIAFTLLLFDTEAGELFFSNVSHSMVTLMLHACLGEDFPEVVQKVGEVNLAYGIMLMLFVVIASLTVMNLLVGVLVEVVSVVAVVEKEEMTCNVLKMHMYEAFISLGKNVDEEINATEFQLVCTEAAVVEALDTIGVDADSLLDLTDVLFPGGKTMQFVDFLEVVLQLRGTNVATVKDIVDLRRFIARSIHQVGQKITAAKGEQPDNVQRVSTEAVEKDVLKIHSLRLKAPKAARAKYMKTSKIG